MESSRIESNRIESKRRILKKVTSRIEKIFRYSRISREGEEIEEVVISLLRMEGTISIGSRAERYFTRRRRGEEEYSRVCGCSLVLLFLHGYKLRRVKVAPISLTPRSVPRSFTVDQVEALIKIFTRGLGKEGEGGIIWRPVNKRRGRSIAIDRGNLVSLVRFN